MRTLALHASGIEVRELQLLLNREMTGRAQLVVDGAFGARTQRALIAFQRLRGVEPSGVADEQTWRALGYRARAQPPQLETAGDPVWMNVARAELGVREFALAGQHNARIVEYHHTTTLTLKLAARDETAWCSSFVNWALLQAGYSGTYNAMAMSWLTWGEATAAKRGAITVIYDKHKSARPDHATGSTSGYHVAFLIEVTRSSVRLLGGNQGNRVAEREYSLGRYEVKGHRWPRRGSGVTRNTYVLC